MIGLLTLIAACAGIYALANISLDAVPDLSDVQVIVYTDWPGRSPSLVEDQITYPITSKFLGAPKVKAVRGLSCSGGPSFMSFSMMELISTGPLSRA